MPVDQSFADASREGDKSAYLHAFVALAASSARAAGRPGADALLAEAIRILEAHFWSEEEGALRLSPAFFSAAVSIWRTTPTLWPAATSRLAWTDNL